MMDHIRSIMLHHLGLFHTPNKRENYTPPLITDIGSCIIQTCSESNLSKMRRNIGSHRVILEEEHNELVNTLQNLQINLRSLSTQVLTILEITIQQWAEHQRTKDECEALRQQIAILQFGAGPVPPSASPTSSVAMSDEVSSPGPQPRLDLNLQHHTRTIFKCMLCLTVFVRLLL
jgi:hypothetical protein